MRNISILSIHSQIQSSHQFRIEKAMKISNTMNSEVSVFLWVSSVRYNFIQKMSVKYNNINPTTQTLKMDRLFGKQLSNLLDQNPHNKVKQVGRIHSQTNRTQSDEPSKMLIKRFNRSSIGQPHLKKTEKMDTTMNIDTNRVEHKMESKAETQRPIQNVQKIQEKMENRDIQMVGEYFQDCFRFMLGQERKNYQLRNYMGEQMEINEKMRGILLDWLIDLHLKFKMFPQTIYATVTIIDLYLSKRPATKQNLQLIGTAALYIASKYEQTYQVPELNDLVHFSAKAFTKDQIIKMEADIIEALDFNLIMETSYKFFEPLAKMCKMEDKNFHLAQYVLELALLDVKFLENKPSLMAASAIYLINKIRKRPEAWPLELEEITGYPEKDLKTCARDLCYLLERADDLSNTKSLKKKFSLVQFHQVTRIKLERKKQ